MTVASRLRRVAISGYVTPQLVAFVASPRTRANPHAAYRRLRRADPVHESPIGVWLLTRHADVVAALRHPGLSSEEERADPDALRLGPLRWFNRGASEGPYEGPFFDVFDRLMLFRDPPDHTRLRALVSKAFTPKRVEAVEARVEELVDETLGPIVARGHVELMGEFAYPLPARVICELIGVPSDAQDVIVHQAPALATGLDPSPMNPPGAIEAANRATAVVTEYLDALIGERRKAPGDDLLSALIEAEDGGDRLDHDELVATILLLLMAGHETTANLIGNGLLAMLSNPSELHAFRVGRGGDREAVEELLRFDGPVQMMQRITVEPTEIGGRTIPSGRYVILCAAAANRDPDVFTRPDVLDLERAPTQHVAFGGGSHFCIGAPLARLEARIALRAIVDRLPNLRLSGRRPAWRPSFTVRGLSHLDVAWDTA